ncbi:histidine kinase [Streptomyces sp. NBC_01498]|uniref:sensor histidine kinase n=1 Tax=Streptomyces sp. NBC_01498 TaxID=2975870 RepID=UPI002E7B02DB|nr:histidine kinase [Streptomyces sp. NBC_01498]WTL24626.1 histidine kinase [Streptomyces sp. NBC_01498]
MQRALGRRVEVPARGDVFDGGVSVVARPHREDVLIAVAGLVGGLLLWAVGLHTQGARPLPDGWVPLPVVALAGAELVRRSMPRTALLVAVLALVLDQFTRGSVATIAMFTDIVYAAVLYGSPSAARRIPWGTALLTVLVTVVGVSWLRSPEGLLLGVVTGAVTIAPATTGVLVRNHRDAAEAARLRAEQTALLAELDRTQAVAAERARMARELHDLVANHLSAIAIHSTAALSLDDARTTRDALKVIRENSVAGLDEMRRLIGLLREAGGEREPAPAPTLGALDALLEQARTNGAGSGLSFALEDRRGAEPAGGGAAALPAPVEMAAYRIVQESLTNALKHAPGGAVTVRLGVDRDRRRRALWVEVVSPYGDRPGPRAPGSGAGLVGMRERVALLDGVFEAGPEPADDTGRDGTAGGSGTGAGSGKIWRVRAELPVGEGNGTS